MVMNGRRRNGQFEKSCIPWWIEQGLPHPMNNHEVAKKMSQTKKRLFHDGRLTPWNKGKHWSTEIRDKISKTKQGKRKSESFRQKRSAYMKIPENNPSFRPEVRERISTALKGMTHPWLRGKNHWNWKGGRKPYSSDFSNALKYLILNRDEKCVLCAVKEDLLVHHIDENKLNNNPENLLILCRSCHAIIHNAGISLMPLRLE